ncbi:MAG: PH domain-containing protein [Sulfuricella sp.]
MSALGAYIATENHAGAALAMIAILLAAGLALILSAVIRRQTTELVLTDRRIITKRGLVSRDTVEINLNKVESLHVNQGLMGRILNYGDVTVVGTGASLSRCAASPGRSTCAKSSAAAWKLLSRRANSSKLNLASEALVAKRKMADEWAGGCLLIKAGAVQLGLSCRSCT